MRIIDADALMQSLGITNMDCDKCAWRDKEWNRCKRGGDFEDACCAIENAPTIEPETEPIEYADCANAMLRMWMDKVVTDGEYYRIMDKLNAHWRKRDE